MADLDYYGADYGAEESSRFVEAAKNFGFANWAGAITSLGLTAGLAVWAVDLTFRDVSGVPVIAALEGPMREAPSDPGGTVAPFQGLALSDITSGGPAAPAPEQIVLAPPPVSLDAPALSERAAASGETAVAEARTAAEDEAAPLQESIQLALSEAVAEGLDEDEVIVGASAPAAPPAVVTPASATPQEPAAADAPIDLAVVPASEPGVAQSVRPRARPADLRRAVAAAAPATVPTEAPAQEPGTQVASLDPSRPSASDADPASLTPGTRVVQLGAYDSESAARGEWERFQGRFGPYMAGKQRLVQKATSGGRDFWRLRVVGFADGSDARRFCAELLAQDTACIPVTIR
ncbi:SPOR domain-containing protein [Jannaschia marina]|uniref:SPOR domain-containing protein n=1 Tax=Jannaschia marina TaxID=2741674 RepID=UPI0015C726DE|nr:SPOR domain-containing protein [Jannaschia marina]